MRSLAMFALLLVIVVLAGATAVMYRRYERASASHTESQTRYAEAINAIAEIQDSLIAITPIDTAMAMPARSLEAEERLSEPQTKQALERIALINASILRTKERIQDLETRLRKSGVRTTGLERMIAGLKERVAEKEALSAQLATQVDSLTTRVAGLETEVKQERETVRARDQALEERRRELATIYYVVGTQKELTAAGIVVTKGGFLGIGKTAQLTGRFDETRFTSLDTDQETVVRAPSVKARILSAQPATSYEFRQEGDQAELHILDAREFRKVKHLVIMTG